MRMGTILESSHLPLHLWLQVIHLMCASKKGISTRQIQRMLRCSMKTAWFLTHRIREAMRDGALPPIGGDGGIIEVDETYIGRMKGAKPKTPWRRRISNVVLTLVERGGRLAPSTSETCHRRNLSRSFTQRGAKATLMTDQGADLT